MYYVMLAVLWCGCVIGAAVFQEAFMKLFFHIGQGLVLGHALTVRFWK